MAEHEPTWSYGQSKLFQTSGEAPDEETWSYGKNVILHEYVEEAAFTVYGKTISKIYGTTPSKIMGVSA